MGGQATFAGVPLSLISLVTLTVQNSALTIVLHYSRISVPKDKMYSAASAVLLNELLKGAISLSIAFRNAVKAAPSSGNDYSRLETADEHERRRGPVHGEAVSVERIQAGGRKMWREVFSSDCWKLSIPACLYVVQNNLQFVAASNLDVPTFQVTYNLKILTTALFSVFLLRRRLSARKWLALLFLAAGVGVVQLQSSTASGSTSHGSHEMDKYKGLAAVFCACMTSGLAGVYFEMVLKGSKADLWIRNVQLSFFSLLPAATAVFAPGFRLFGGGSTTPNPTAGQPVFANFGGWAWAVVLIQVFGGLVTALVIRYSDNIMKGFATSLAIVLSFCAGIVLFDFQVTLSFLVGTCMVVASTYMYNSPDAPRRSGTDSPLPSSLPSPSLAKGPFIPAISARGLSGSNPISSHSYTPAANFALHATASGTTPSMAEAAGLASASYRRSVSGPLGAQTPDHSVAVFPLDNRRSLEHTHSHSANTSLYDPPRDSVPPPAHQFAFPASVPGSPQDPLRPLARVRAAEQAATNGTGMPERKDSMPIMADPVAGEGYSSGRAPGTPASPDPNVRSRSPLPRTA
ncbi:hypothetical protein NBRC10512_004388 [Rhodotorula toruloides]|uniref:RHTO0S15e03994g1_1 n=2 Tax=Rhodotorula toruloides TaxID=5286 RepID=A0A061BDB1_RHOTO|nr:UDP-galactose transporter [Rhodotorula toruloides NP11]EMS25401.1 UDP-galactose transporter [Rhodotorula toruloides NP11]CDR47940.1 RHTO0S15e03994g1_1 [Rhodotorula toruloides]